jgi:hypothetical protein
MKAIAFGGGMMKRQIFAITLVLFMVGLATASTTLNVPGSYANIQAAINASVNGDTVMVAPGTYTGSGNRNLDFNGKKITVRSANGPADCNIDCQGLGRGFSFDSYEDANSVVKGFTIRNGTANNADGYGGAIELSFSSPTIADCVFLNNTASIGGGIECFLRRRSRLRRIGANDKKLHFFRKHCQRQWRRGDIQQLECKTQSKQLYIC